MKVRSTGSHSVVSGSGHRRLDYPMPGGSTGGEKVGARDDDDAAIAPTRRRRPRPRDSSQREAGRGGTLIAQLGSRLGTTSHPTARST
jgi:hypothetical protein